MRLSKTGFAWTKEIIRAFIRNTYVEHRKKGQLVSTLKIAKSFINQSSAACENCDCQLQEFAKLVFHSSIALKS